MLFVQLHFKTTLRTILMYCLECCSLCVVQWCFAYMCKHIVTKLVCLPVYQTAFINQWYKKFLCHFFSLFPWWIWLMLWQAPKKKFCIKMKGLPTTIKEVRVFVCVCVCLRTHVCVLARVCVCACMHVCVLACTCVCVLVCVWEREREWRHV